MVPVFEGGVIPISHEKEFGIYHWDTFDNETWLVDEADTLEEAEEKVRNKYGDRISNNGADKVDIVNKNGDVIKNFSIG